MKEQEKLKATVLKLYSTGTKASDIIAQTGTPLSTVYYWIKNGIPKEMSSLNLRDYHFLKQKCERQEKIIAILKSAPCAATAPLQERLVAIEQTVSDKYNVNTLCEALDVAKGTCYNHTLRNKRGETKSAQRRRELFPIIEQIYHESNQTYGAGRITVVMRERGILVEEGTVARIMHENGLFSIRGGAKALYYRNKERKDNLIKQEFTVKAPNPYDNSVCESFFKTLKQEEIYRKDYRSEKDMLRSITTFMEFYNNSRPHSMNGYRTPNKHEAAYNKRKAIQKA